MRSQPRRSQGACLDPDRLSRGPSFTRAGRAGPRGCHGPWFQSARNARLDCGSGKAETVQKLSGRSSPSASAGAREFEYHGRPARSAIWKTPVSGRVAVPASISPATTRRIARRTAAPTRRSTPTPSRMPAGGSSRSAAPLPTPSSARTSRPKASTSTGRSWASDGRSARPSSRCPNRACRAGGSACA